MADRIKNKDFWASIQTFSRNPLEFSKIVVPLDPEISPLQLKGYVDVAHSCRLYGAVSVLWHFVIWPSVFFRQESEEFKWIWLFTRCFVSSSFFVNFWHIAFVDEDRLVPCNDDALRNEARQKIDRYIADHPPVETFPRSILSCYANPSPRWNPTAWAACIRCNPRNVTKPLNICSDFHLGRHFFGLVGGFFVGLSVTLWLGMTLWGGYSMTWMPRTGYFCENVVNNKKV